MQHWVVTNYNLELMIINEPFPKRREAQDTETEPAAVDWSGDEPLCPLWGPMQDFYEEAFMKGRVRSESQQKTLGPVIFQDAVIRAVQNKAHI